MSLSANTELPDLWTNRYTSENAPSPSFCPIVLCPCVCVCVCVCVHWFCVSVCARARKRERRERQREREGEQGDALVFENAVDTTEDYPDNC